MNVRETPTAYRLALDAARKELSDIREEYERLGKRKVQLEGFIVQTEALISGSDGHKSAQSQEQLPIEIYADIPLPTKTPLWRRVQIAMAGSTEPFTAGKATEEIERLGGILDSPNKIEVVRQALRSRPDIFEKLEDGKFLLKEESENGVVIKNILASRMVSAG